MGALASSKNTGELSEEPPFVKLYIRQMCDLKKLNHTQYKMFWFMLTKMDSQNEVIYRSRHRKEFCKDLGISEGTFANNIKALMDSQLIKRLGPSEFLVNKKYVVKTDWASVQSIKWEKEYTEEGVTETIKINDKELPY